MGKGVGRICQRGTHTEVVAGRHGQAGVQQDGKVVQVAVGEWW